MVVSAVDTAADGMFTGGCYAVRPHHAAEPRAGARRNRETPRIRARYCGFTCGNHRRCQGFKTITSLGMKPRYDRTRARAGPHKAAASSTRRRSRGCGHRSKAAVTCTQAFRPAAHARNSCTAGAAPSSETGTALSPRRAVAVWLNSRPFSTLSKPLSVTVSDWPPSETMWRSVVMVRPLGPSKRMAKIGPPGQGSTVLTSIAYCAIAGSYVTRTKAFSPSWMSSQTRPGLVSQANAGAALNKMTATARAIRISIWALTPPRIKIVA